MKVLLTGGTGFVGGHVARALHERGHEVVALARRSSPRSRIEAWTTRWVEVDLLDEDGLHDACKGLEAIVHAAGVTRARNEADFFRVNADGTAALARAAARAGVPRLLLVGSLAARGPDARAGAGDAPVGAYGRSKLEAERRLQREGADLRRVVVRPGAVYGPGDADLRPLFTWAARGLLPLPPADLRFQPVYAPDLARRIVDLVEASEPPPDPLPLVEPRAYAWREAAPLFAGAAERAPRVVHLPPWVFAAAALASETWASLTRAAPRLDRRRARDLSRATFTVPEAEARRAWGDVPVTPLADGARETFRWYRGEGWA